MRWLAVSLGCLFAALWIILSTAASALITVGALDTPGRAYDVEVVGGLVYVAAGDFGLRIMDFGPEYFPGQCGGPGFIQLNPNSSLESDVVCTDSLKTYWFSAIASESYAVRVATITGDPDLYGSTSQACIESLPTPGGGYSYESSTTPGVAAEEIQFTAAATGPYYIGVHGITDGAYQIEVPEPSRWLLLAAGLGCRGCCAGCGCPKPESSSSQATALRKNELRSRRCPIRCIRSSRAEEWRKTTH